MCFVAESTRCGRKQASSTRKIARISHERVLPLEVALFFCTPVDIPFLVTIVEKNIPNCSYGSSSLRIVDNTHEFSGGMEHKASAYRRRQIPRVAAGLRFSILKMPFEAFEAELGEAGRVSHSSLPPEPFYPVRRIDAN